MCACYQPVLQPLDFRQTAFGGRQQYLYLDGHDAALCHSLGWPVEGCWAYGPCRVQLTLPLHHQSREFLEVAAQFADTCRGQSMHAVNVYRVQNPGVYRRYLNNKDRYMRLYGKCEVKKLFHGTKLLMVDSILKDNLDTRFLGAVGSRFGQGVNFSAISYYASQFCDSSQDKFLLLCDVLVSNMIQVPEGSALKVPPLLPWDYTRRYDTTTKNIEKLDVVVKYCKDEFYPTHVIHFQHNQNQHKKKTYDWFSFYN